jgi:hypothetical protein
MRTGPRINAGILTPSHGLFLTYRGENRKGKIIQRLKKGIL